MDSDASGKTGCEPGAVENQATSFTQRQVVEGYVSVEETVVCTFTNTSTAIPVYLPLALK